ncbi:DUF6429 family protein [Caldisalinibacter kiritimatiensis]|uniref:Putative transposase n=1 Tax=Caldisalinibacter kiritimatiensis TaxID=1304284 RepID=R1CD59_9FIRM|nr:DUF6429 family protein [Caldisalinibacter kiritimatiensis]EOD00235.1 Putative transposase [Caldisalinibacter kiritimatiensis]
MNTKIKELTLLLLYLTSWEEDEFGNKLRRSWKGYPFEILDELVDEKLVFGSKRAKSVYFTEEGIKKAEELIDKYLDQEVH